MKILLSSVKESSREYRLRAKMSLGGLEGRAESGEVLALVNVRPAGERWYLQGQVEGSFPFRCDRCRSPFDGKLTGEFTMIVLAKLQGDLDPEDSEEVLVLASGSQEVDLSEKVREALILDLPIRLLCDEGCKGLCPQCGANRNLEECRCEPAEADPRWSALRNLKKLMESEGEAGEAGPRSDESEV